ncbi:putative endoribonuclease L-PSP [Monocercomonoides exilis]|uniref:putative endoribonuclease L-PSP n=1 Tax=Monocercomonoides exilis TaxID=2049356 RepID=UPI003559FF72|nr:putative endoribonuclease L-PSP [Monocercomonoides exilis]|eukprot:MONOS_11438.1-p1 / transcript=MONOS_11438.1 / gene=MONOS_11438 / organism=Monocercomonoides_exilis_PA203 / gene_product=endoribonuclease L-PSP / transcript_product=endoribonuclease L-PSP / location=Mono_scaffold00574:6377-6757(-) / protein_length=126 / sequence_SO=supercontig / SO=protein_coding / is_pseudo=false
MSSVIFTDKAPLPIGPYCQARKVGNLLFLSGQIPIDIATKKLVEGGIKEQTAQVFRNISAVLEAAGAKLENIVKTTVLLADMADFGEMNGVYATFFPSAPPARSAFAVKQLPMGAMVEIECIAALE